MKKRKILRVFALLCALAQLATLTALAAEQKASLTMTCAVDGVSVADVDCRLYRVADVNGTDFTLTSQFRDSAVSLSDLTTSALWQTAADSLAVYASAAENRIAPAAEAKSDENGRIAFSSLDAGMYLAVLTPVTKDRTTYRFSAEMLSLPQWGWKNGAVSYDVTALPKGTSYTAPADTVDVTVLKSWNDANTSNRPAEVTIALLCGGETYETVTLSADNNWRYTWTGLPAGDEWQVLERSVPDGYTVAYSADGSVFTVTNTSTAKTPVSAGSSTSGKLPQTGQLWWPVPMMAAVGLLLFGAGWCVRRRDNGNEEK